MSLTEIERRTLWVRAGGRCTLCMIYLLEGGLTSYEVPLGEGAHNIGSKDSVKSARGKDNSLPVTGRDTVDDLLLACSHCHTEIDKKKDEGTLDVELLDKLKREHEAAIKTATGCCVPVVRRSCGWPGAIRGARCSSLVTRPLRPSSCARTRFPFFVDSD